MKDSTRILIGLGGVVVGSVGALGTLYQIFGFQVVWPVLVVVGLGIISVTLWARMKKYLTVLQSFAGRWFLDEGRLIIGNTRNVALRLNTLQILLSGFREELGEEYDDVVKPIGRDIGLNFAEDLERELTQRGVSEIHSPSNDPGTVREKLRLWVSYDSTTGMGGFDVGGVNVDGSGNLSGHVTLEHSFVASDRSEDYMTCSLLAGYIEGILHGLFNQDVVVDETKCMAVTNEGSCRFRVRQAE